MPSQQAGPSFYGVVGEMMLRRELTILGHAAFLIYHNAETVALVTRLVLALSLAVGAALVARTFLVIGVLEVLVLVYVVSELWLARQRKRTISMLQEELRVHTELSARERAAPE